MIIVFKVSSVFFYPHMVLKLDSFACIHPAQIASSLFVVTFCQLHSIFSRHLFSTTT